MLAGGTLPEKVKGLNASREPRRLARFLMHPAGELQVLYEAFLLCNMHLALVCP